MENSYYKNLMMTVIRSSESDNWKDAVVEWDIDDCEEDLSCSSECVCGKEKEDICRCLLNCFRENYCVGYMKKAHLIQNIMIMMEKMIMNLC